ncbi:heme peroxidase family protein [Xenococcus sp. PCC 7305]|uniref:peroxidase family protein n=1 Tax=Xenococcus sp. PCC 7305 TaxID=102125 RepID=UPI0002AC834F|nr:peroxidase family protein [Xenococcus sp. PCC 7305]ELS01276.1 heme peroxidase family protein [Xenococcus sp. PCC 7305]
MTNNLIDNNPFDSENFVVRSIDGIGNNLQHFDYGSAGTPLLDIANTDYSNGYSTPSGGDRPNPRTISNAVALQVGDVASDRNLSNFIWAFGQFVDHDLDLVPEGSNEELEAAGIAVNIPVSPGDPWLDPQETGTVIIPITDSAFIPGTGTSPDNYRLLPNNITSWIDGSNIYGSDTHRANFLRTFENGELKVSEGDLLPFNDGSIDNDDPRGGDPTSLFVAGDIRSNENSVLVAMHTLFVREHNRLAELLDDAHPDWNDEQIYQRARSINIAQYQSVIYNEYLPSLLGEDAVPDYSGYDSSINPNISRTFASAAFRFGHSQLSTVIPRLDTQGEVIEAGNLTLSEVFFRSADVVQEAGIDPILRGVASSVSQNVDTQIIDDVRNLLFRFGPDAIGRDLFAINLQRGRLHGLADYNTIREAFGLEPVHSFDEITSNEELQHQLESLYTDIDNIDAFVGLLAEDHLPGSSVGETIQTVLLQQFIALREGDRFYYENQFSATEITEIEETSLSDIILRNTDTTVIQDNVFFLPEESAPDFDTDIFRFRQTVDGQSSYLYVGNTESENLRENYADTFVEEGYAFKVSDEPHEDLIDLYRFRSDRGIYLYVGEAERHSINDDPNLANVFTYEGWAFSVYGVGAGAGTEFYRFRDLNSPNNYLYATGTEAEVIRTEYANTYLEEGVAFEALI